MLTLTENAGAIVNEITSHPGLADTAGLRTTSGAPPQPAFEVTAAAQGQPGDQVLDAAVDPSGKIEFALADRG